MPYLKNLDSTVKNLDQKYHDANSRATESQETLDRLKKVLVGDESEAEATPWYEDMQDYYLKQAMEAEKEGQGIPLTANLAVKLAEVARQNEALTKQLEDLTKKQQVMADPMVQLDNQTYMNIDTTIENQLGKIYGEVPAFQFDAITKELSSTINQIKKDHPQAWDEIRRSPTKQQQLANHFVMKNVPPKAREMMQNEKIQNTPMTQQELLQAFDESKEIEDPKQRTRIQQNIRQSILEQMLQDKRKRW